MDEPVQQSPAPSSALVAARRRIKALTAEVRKLEEERGLALRRVGELEAALSSQHVDDRALARALALAMPRHAKREVSSRVLVVLLCLREGQLTVSALRDLLGIAQATASEWVQEAVGAGVVLLEVSTQDRRKHVAQLTPKGWVYVKDRRAP